MIFGGQRSDCYPPHHHRANLLVRSTSRPLRIHFERDLGREGAQESVHDQTQKNPQPGEDEAKVVADRCEDGVGGIAVTALEIAAAEVTFALHVGIARQRLGVQHRTGRLVRGRWW